MKKKILVISILAIILPIIGISVINILEDNTKINFSYIVMPLLLLSILFSIYMILLSYKDKINKKMKYVMFIINIILDIGLIIYTIFIFKNPLYMIIGLISSNLLPYLIYKFKILLFLIVAGLYPILFYSYKVNKTTIIMYICYMSIFLLFSIYKKFHKTKIYLYDNY